MTAAEQMPDQSHILQKAISFAARAHHGQVRKDGETPYAAHVMRVAFTVRHLFGVDDATTLTAAVLHDTLEDTNTDYDDLEEEFGADVADLVVYLTKDGRLPEDERERIYFESLAKAPWQARLIKLADTYDNVLDSSTSRVAVKSFAKAHKLLALPAADNAGLAKAHQILSDFVAAQEQEEDSD